MPGICVVPGWLCGGCRGAACDREGIPGQPLREAFDVVIKGISASVKTVCKEHRGQSRQKYKPLYEIAVIP